MIIFSLLSVLFASPDSPYSISVEAKIIPLFRINPDFDANTDDSSWTVQQNFRLIAKGEWEGLIVKASLQDARLWGLESSPIVSSSALATLHEGYVQMGTKDNRSFYVRTGRQEYKMYDGMLIFPRYWNLYNIAFNGIRTHYEQQFVSVDAAAFVLKGASQFTTTCATDATDCTPEDINAMGDFLTLIESDINLSTKIHLQPYYLGIHQGPNESNPERDRNIFSPGLRLEGKLTPTFEYILDTTQQFGIDGENDHRAWRTQATLSYKWSIFKTMLHYEERSGDGDSTDTTTNDFEPFFSAGHKFRGFGDYIGLSNIRDISGRFTVDPTPYASILFDYHYFQLSNPKGNWFTINGTRGMGSGDDSTLGQEFDLVVELQPYKKTSIKVGHALFLPMGEGKKLAGDDWSSSTYIWATFKR